MIAAAMPVPDDMTFVSLAELNEFAELLTRTDRKYIMSAELLGRFLAGCHHDVAMLEIDGSCEFEYHSVYFDTEELALYRAAATNRRRQFKVRTRAYENSGDTMLEVKTKDGRGRTVKARLEYDRSDQRRLTLAGQQFVDAVSASPGVAAKLAPVLTTRYVRSTLANLAAGTRVTIDRGLVCTDLDDRSLELKHVIVETKSVTHASAIDRWLWREGVRPVRLTKYCTAMAMLDPTLPANRWNRTLDTYFR